MESSFLKSLLSPTTSSERIVVLPPEVDSETVWSMLHLLYTGRCNIEGNRKRTKLMELLETLGFEKIVKTLTNEYILNPKQHWLKKHNESMNNQQHKSPPPSFFSFDMNRNDNNDLPRDVNRNDENVHEEAQEDHDISAKIQGQHYCQMCGMQMENSDTLRYHYTFKHFYYDVKAMIKDDKSKVCEICSVELTRSSGMIRHMGVTHRKVIPLIENECGGEVVDVLRCSLCGKKMDKNTCLGAHLVETHYKSKLDDLFRKSNLECYLCKKKLPNAVIFSTHIGMGHGRAMQWYKADLAAVAAGEKTLPSRQKMKKCHMCSVTILGPEDEWTSALYSHFAKKHYAEKLLKDYKLDEKTCGVCGEIQANIGMLLIHLGAEHKLVEQYMNSYEKSLYY